MRVAIPLFGNRVSPRFLYADQVLLAHVDNGAVTSRKALDSYCYTGREWLSQLQELDVDVFVCGGVEADFETDAQALGITVHKDVAGSVDTILDALVSGALVSGFGLFRYRETNLQTRDASWKLPEEKEPETRGGMDCTLCADRACLKGVDCLAHRHMAAVAAPDPAGMAMRDTAEEISGEIEERLCRVAETIEFARRMEYSHVGVAFCTSMFREAEILAGLLRHYFRVTTLCCKLGGRGISHDVPHQTPDDIACNPVGQAMVFNQAGTELNIVAGLCVGCDALFSAHSRAPVTTLFVKDRMLANNPMGALYSRFYLKRLMENIR